MGKKRRKTKMKNFRKISALLLAVMMIALSCLFVACGEKEVEKKYSITVIVVNDKAEEKTFNIKTAKISQMRFSMRSSFPALTANGV